MIHFGHRSGSRRGRIVAAGSGQSCRVARHLPNRPLLAIAGALFLLLALFWSYSLWAHAALVATQPAAGAVLAEPPEQVSLTFNEPVAPLRFQLLTPGGRALEPAALRHQGGEIQLRLPPLEEQGSHVLSWRVVSADGHPVGGSLLFSIGQAGAVASAGEAAHAGRSLALWLARLAVYAGLFFGLGGVAFRALSAAGRSGEPSNSGRRTLLGLVLLGGAAVVLSLGLFGLDALDLGFGAWQTPEAWPVPGRWRHGRSVWLHCGGRGRGAGEPGCGLWLCWACPWLPAATPAWHPRSGCPARQCGCTALPSRSGWALFCR